jgi:hypothetical protein
MTWDLLSRPRSIDEAQNPLQRTEVSSVINFCFILNSVRSHEMALDTLLGKKANYSEEQELSLMWNLRMLKNLIFFRREKAESGTKFHVQG